MGLASPLSEREYAERFDAFKKISSEWQSMQQWLGEDFLPNCGCSTPLNILSTGRGDGEVDIALMKLILKRWRIGSYTATDPDPHHNQAFESRFHESDLDVPKLEIVTKAFPNMHIGKNTILFI